MNKLYHITTPDNLVSIMENGLVANGNGEVNSGLSEDGYIYLFENKSYRHPITGQVISVADDIALNELFITDYVMLEIDVEGIKGEIEHDNVAELSAFAQWKVKQDKIGKEHIDIYGVYKVNPWWQQCERVSNQQL